MWNDLKRYIKIPLTQKKLLFEALFALAIARAAIACLPFRRIATWLGTQGAESPRSVSDHEIVRAKEIGWAVSVLAQRIPWDGRCLSQALAATGMLRRRGMEGTVTFGAAEDSSAEFKAHAWLRLGPLIVTGGPGNESFKTLTTFARKLA